MPWILKALTLLLVTFFKRATAYVNDTDLFPYLESAGSSRFYFEDDGYATVYLRQPFRFLDETYSSVYISGNGYITFGTGMK